MVRMRSIMETILLDIMFDLPGLEGVEKVVISRQVVEGISPPLSAGLPARASRPCPPLAGLACVFIALGRRRLNDSSIASFVGSDVPGPNAGARYARSNRDGPHWRHKTSI
jgi:hypothetical protein